MCLLVCGGDWGLPLLTRWARRPPILYYGNGYLCDTYGSNSMLVVTVFDHMNRSNGSHKHLPRNKDMNNFIQRVKLLFDQFLFLSLLFKSSNLHYWSREGQKFRERKREVDESRRESLPCIDWANYVVAFVGGFLMTTPNTTISPIPNDNFNCSTNHTINHINIIINIIIKS